MARDLDVLWGLESLGQENVLAAIFCGAKTLKSLSN
jgi:hypothetical protein